jgi:hypothetical protein
MRLRGYLRNPAEAGRGPVRIPSIVETAWSGVQPSASG